MSGILNREGYSDPTAYNAIRNIERSRKRHKPSERVFRRTCTVPIHRHGNVSSAISRRDPDVGVKQTGVVLYGFPCRLNGE